MASHPSWQLAAGERLAPGLRVLERLGGGRRAEVYLVERDSGDVAVAKLARPAAEAEGAGPPPEVNLRVLRREAEVLGALAHQAFPRLLDATLDGARPHLLIEHVEGPRLSTLVRRYGPLAREQVWPLVSELAAGLDELHRCGWVHLDVKPANVVVGARPRLIDLGVARDLDAAGRIRGRVGTARWMSPEQHHPASFGGVGPPADVWGLAVCVYFSLTGRAPLDALRDRERDGFSPTREDVEAIDVEVLPAPFSDVVGPSLAWDPAARPSAVELAGFLAGGASAASRGRRRWWRRRR